MANRAYLFSTEFSDVNQIKGFEKPYYDSRHFIPLLWFLFFTNDSIKTKTCWLEEDLHHEEFSWEELILIENKELAITRFSENLKILAEIWKGIEKHPDIFTFIQKVRSWKGQNLVLDPSEIVETDMIPAAIQDFNLALNILYRKDSWEFTKALNDYSGNAPKKSFFHRLFPFNRDYEIEKEPNYFIGYTYW